MTWWLGKVETLGPKASDTYTFEFPYDVNTPFRGPMVVMAVPLNPGITNVDVGNVVINAVLRDGGGANVMFYDYTWTAKNLSDTAVQFRFAHGMFDSEKSPS